MHRCTRIADNLQTDQHVFYEHQFWVVAILHKFFHQRSLLKEQTMGVHITIDRVNRVKSKNNQT